jgi:hypothetical protein
MRTTAVSGEMTLRAVLGDNALYASGGASNMTAGYYFMPRAAPASAYRGSGQLE